MSWTGIVVVAVVTGALLTGGGVVSAERTCENPACDNPGQGLIKSVDGSDGTSLERAGPGIINSRTKIGCEELQPS